LASFSFSTSDRAVMPCLSEFNRERDFPAAVLVPRPI
jgi:hypothetical protein